MSSPSVFSSAGVMNHPVCDFRYSHVIICKVQLESTLPAKASINNEVISLVLEVWVTVKN